jgi:hypothetical protein
VGVLGLLGVGLVVGGGVASYRAYEFVEHDNEFCLSCHLMEEPFELFAESAHRGLGCKACHKPTFAARSQMALTQILENPDSLATHAEVPNEKCADCHIEGDPQRWESIRNSAGHRIHFESDDPSLEGLQCVECHATGLHEFAAVDRTCGQSGCHTESRIQLGGMSDLTIHCAACHGFSTPVDPSEPVEMLTAAVTPDAEECLSCHVMRTLVDMPPDEPHGQACGLCHNPHEQSTPEEAVASCATGSCHTDAAAVSPMHRGLESGVLEECTTCHEAHDWRLDANDCLACHQQVFLDDPPGGNPLAAGGPPGLVPPAGMGAGASGREVRVASLAAVGLVHSVVQESASGLDSVFRHADHPGVSCLECHGTEESHGRVRVTSLSDCRSCHHTAPVSNDCVACHTSAPSGTIDAPRTLSFSVADPVERELPFNHDAHAAITCAECHTGGESLSAESLSCQTCHMEHHRTEGVRCADCHAPVPASAHPTAQVHVGCTGGACHSDPPIPGLAQGLPRTPDFCLSCHVDQEDHQAGRDCAECHQVPGELPMGGAG